MEYITKTKLNRVSRSKIFILCIRFSQSFPATLLECITFTFNADYKLKPWLTSSSSFNFADAKWYGLSPTSSSEANYFSRLLSLPPTFRGYNADGEMLLGNNSGDGNQLLNLDKLIRDNNTDKFTMVQSFNIDIMKGLALKLSANWYFDEEKLEAFNRDYLSSPGNYNTARASSASYDRTLSQTYNAVLNYDNQITKDHYLAAMAGFEYYDAYNKGFSASGSGAATDDFMDLSYTSTDKGKRSIDSWHSRQRIMSFFGRVNYDFQSKYLVSFVMRKDGYSKLVDDNRWGVFPGISAGWVFGKEEFIIGYRFSPEEIEEPGITIEDTLALVDTLSGQDIDYLHISLKDYNATSSRDENDKRIIGKLISEKINGRKPLIGVGSITTKEKAEDAINLCYDLVALGRILLTEPKWVHKIKNNEEIIDYIDLKNPKEQYLPEKMVKKIEGIPGWINLK